MNCSLSRTFTFPPTHPPTYLPIFHLLCIRPLSISFPVSLVSVSCVATHCSFSSACWIMEGVLEATALMKHAARSHISQWQGETCCCGVNYSAPKYHSNHHARTGDKKPPATSGLPLFPCRQLYTTRPHWWWQWSAAKTPPAAQRTRHQDHFCFLFSKNKIKYIYIKMTRI